MHFRLIPQGINAGGFKEKGFIQTACHKHRLKEESNRHFSTGHG
jgi:hypothetical protein